MAERLLERHLTVSEIARALRVSDMTVRRWIASCQLPAIRVGSHSYRVPESSYRTFVADRVVTPSNTAVGATA
jgi:excisionase family DNA binding protein